MLCLARNIAIEKVQPNLVAAVARLGSRVVVVPSATQLKQAREEVRGHRADPARTRGTI